MKPARILVVDDEPGIRQSLCGVLGDEGYQARAVAGGEECLEDLTREPSELVLLDVWLPGIDGMETLARIQEIPIGDRPAVVMISGHGNIEAAVKATKLGAFDFLEKPLSIQKLAVVLKNALDHRRLQLENMRLRGDTESKYRIIGDSVPMKALRQQMELMAATNGRVLIYGESGTGKELVAHAIHALSARESEAFVEVNCAAIPEELIESELFGHIKGSFTGAHESKIGKFRKADAGTLFLDEVGDMSLQAQAKVLRVLQDGVVTRIGGSKQISVDVRVLAATNKALETEIAEGRFREDLFYRLNVVPIHVPPLRERREDIPSLVAHFVDVLTKREGVAPKVIDVEAVQRLTAMDWPGNVRELRNTIERLLILSSSNRITADDVARLVGGRAGAEVGVGSLLECKTFEEFKHAAERAFLLAKLREYDWNVSETARGLDMPRSNLYKKIERYGLTRETVS